MRVKLIKLLQKPYESTSLLPLRTREEFVLGGLDFILSDRPHPPKPRKLDGRQEAFLIATACSKPPVCWVRWTMQLLADHLVSIDMVDSISDETVRQT